eukprot:INCI18346.1.p1 GENE.INCI18346.1~~INCI18346.1.p1  ORF type:complete len:452 (+),score=71.16 INCI18346.1:113-1468(+)
MASETHYEFGELPGSAGHVRVRHTLGMNPTWLPDEIDDIPEAVVCATTYEGYKQYGATGPKKLNRVGVPGGDRISFDKKCTIFFSWRGSAFQAAHQSFVFYFYLLMFAVCLGFMIPLMNPELNATDGTPLYRNATKFPSLPSGIITAMGSLCTFFSTFYVAHAWVRFDKRFQDICKTNGGVTLVTCLSSSYLPYREAAAVIRYAAAILHIYYYCIKGAMTPEEWKHLVTRKMLTIDEVLYLHNRPKAGAIVYYWAARVLRQSQDERLISENQAMRIEENLALDRGLSAKQIAYAITPLPKPYFHMASIAIHFWLVWVVWNNAITIASGWGDLTEEHPDDRDYSVVMTFIGALMLIYLFSALWKVAILFADPFGYSDCHYDLNVDLKGLWVEANIVAEAAYNRRIDDTQGPPLAAIALPSSAEGVEMTTKGPHRRKKKATTSAQRTKVAARH